MRDKDHQLCVPEAEAMGVLGHTSPGSRVKKPDTVWGRGCKVVKSGSRKSREGGWYPNQRVKMGGGGKKRWRSQKNVLVGVVQKNLEPRPTHGGPEGDNFGSKKAGNPLPGEEDWKQNTQGGEKRAFERSKGTPLGGSWARKWGKGREEVQN